MTEKTESAATMAEEGSARMPELSVGAADFAIMRRACLLYLADHGGVDTIRHDVVPIVVTGERQANLLIGSILPA